MTYKQKVLTSITKINTHMGYEHVRYSKISRGFFVVALLNYRGIAKYSVEVSGYKEMLKVIAGVNARIAWEVQGWV